MKLQTSLCNVLVHANALPIVGGSGKLLGEHILGHGELMIFLNGLALVVRRSSRLHLLLNCRNASILEGTQFRFNIKYIGNQQNLPY